MFHGRIDIECSVLAVVSTALNNKLRELTGNLDSLSLEFSGFGQ